MLDGDRLLTGGDDGRVVATSADGERETLADEKGKWIDALAARDGAARLVRRQDRARARRQGRREELDRADHRARPRLPAQGLPRSPRAHYNGVSLWFPNADATPQVLEWKGSHLDATVSPDGRFLVTSMQENALHGWRLADGRNMRMTGYPAQDALAVLVA